MNCGGTDKEADGLSVLSGHSDRSKTTSPLEAEAKLPWFRNVTCKDLKDITPTLLILLGGVLIMIFVIPYAFQSVIVQLKNVAELDAIQERNKQRQINATLERQAEIERNKTLEAEMASGSTPDDSDSIPEPSRLLSSESLTSFSEGSNT
jgi:hypothetical protein